MDYALLRKNASNVFIIIAGLGGHPGICKITGKIFSAPEQV
jgi:hypothetical protein